MLPVWLCLILNRNIVAFNATSFLGLPPIAHPPLHRSMPSSASFDPTRTYRYSLWREWDGDGQRLVFIMLNPSTADADTNDPTIRRCLRFAQAWDYGSMEVVNLFAYRTPSPNDLRAVPDPVGAENDRYLAAAAAQADCIVMAWGNWGSLHQRDRAVYQLLAHYPNVYCLGTNQSGQPRHPLYLKRDSRLTLWQSAIPQPVQP